MSNTVFLLLPFACCLMLTLFSSNLNYYLKNGIIHFLGILFLSGFLFYWKKKYRKTNRFYVWMIFGLTFFLISMISLIGRLGIDESAAKILNFFVDPHHFGDPIIAQPVTLYTLVILSIFIIVWMNRKYFELNLENFLFILASYFYCYSFFSAPLMNMNIGFITVFIISDIYPNLSRTINQSAFFNTLLFIIFVFFLQKSKNQNRKLIVFAMLLILGFIGLNSIFIVNAITSKEIYMETLPLLYLYLKYYLLHSGILYIFVFIIIRRVLKKDADSSFFSETPHV